jgi:phage FluMu protein Com
MKNKKLLFFTRILPSLIYTQNKEAREARIICLMQACTFESPLKTKIKIMKEDFLNEFRCDCGKLLFKGSGLSGKIEIKCKRCGKIKTITGKFTPFFLRDKNRNGYYRKIEAI